MAAPYPLGLRTIIRDSKSRSQPAAFTVAQPRRGYGYVEPTGTDVPIFWDVMFRFTTCEAIAFRIWFTQTIRRGLDEFDMPIRTEFGLITYTVSFLPDSLLPLREVGEVFEYTATIWARKEVIPPDAITAHTTQVFNGPIPLQNLTVGAPYSLDVASYFAGGLGPFSYSVAAGSLPIGLTLNPTTGMITGTVAAAVEFSGLVIERSGAYCSHISTNAFSMVVGGSAPTDPDFSSVVLLLLANGANTSTTFVDSSSYAHTMTAGGDAQVSTAVSAFVGGAARFDGDGDYISTPDPTTAEFDIGAGAFTMEADVYLEPGSAGTMTVISKVADVSLVFHEWSLRITQTYAAFYYGARSNSQADIRLFWPTTMTQGVKHHIAIQRNASGQWACWLDGVKGTQYQVAPTATSLSYGSVTTGTYTDTINIGGTSHPVWVGGAFYGEWLDGLMKNFRWTAAARYTGNFTPPTVYPTS